MQKCRFIRKKELELWGIPNFFPPLGVPLFALDLQNAAFPTEKKLKKTLKK